MDVLVTWKDDTKNVVSTSELQTVKKGDKFQLGVKVKMLYKRKWYFGSITAIDLQESSSDDEPLCKYISRNVPEYKNRCEYKDCQNSVLTTCLQCACFLCAEHYDSIDSCNNDHLVNIALTVNQDLNNDLDEHNICQDIDSNDSCHLKDNDNVKYCEFSVCTEEVFSACHRCSCFLCWNHFVNCDSSCEDHFSSANLLLKSPIIKSDAKTSFPALQTNTQRCEFFLCTNPVLATCFVCNCFLCDVHFGVTIAQSCLNHKKLTDGNQSQKTLENQETEELLTDCEEMETDILNISGETAVLLDTLDGSPSILRNGGSLFCEFPACTDVFDVDCPDCALPLCLQHLHIHTSIASCGRAGQFENLQPEDFVMDGAPRENLQTKSKRVNKFKRAKSLRQQGKEYVSPYSKKVIPEKKVGAFCNIEYCTRYGNYCHLFSEEVRENILLDFYSTGTLSSQREYIARFTEKKPVARRTTATSSRRQFTFHFYLPLKDEKHKVCKKLFLNTLGISEKSVRTSLEKIKDTGIIENDKRGGRQGSYVETDAEKRRLIKQHINRFPRVESHYCRKDSSKEYLHHDLSVRKMHSMFLEEYEPKVCFTLYRSVFREMNLSIHRPKKDQCSLCITYREGTTDVKEKLQEKYTEHISEKDKVRKIKEECKNEHSETVRCASFDLQQVIYLPQSNESAVFYKRRLANYNFTIYDLNSKQCTCNVWHEAISKRGASEISTAVYYFLANYDTQGVKKVNLFSDGCQGQNKNSVMAAMLLYFMMHSESVEELSLRFFCPSHGQSEGDSVHSAVAHAMDKAGNIFVPSQLVPIIRLARKSPYNVKEYNYDDFLNFKDFSLKIKLLLVRKDDQNGDPIKWTDMMEFKVIKSKPGTLFFKTSHLQEKYRSITVKRQNYIHFRSEIDPVSRSPNDNRISKEKYRDLLSMCSGLTPIIRNQEHVLFYKSLPHD